MKAKELLYDTMEELEKEERMQMTGGTSYEATYQKAKAVSTVLHALTGNMSCYNPPTPAKSGHHVCTWR